MQPTLHVLLFRQKVLSDYISQHMRCFCSLVPSYRNQLDCIMCFYLVWFHVNSPLKHPSLKWSLTRTPAHQSLSIRLNAVCSVTRCCGRCWPGRCLSKALKGCRLRGWWWKNKRYTHARTHTHLRAPFSTHLLAYRPTRDWEGRRNNAMLSWFPLRAGEAEAGYF